MHYVKLLPYLEPHAINAGVEPGQWATTLFNDLTSNGTQLELCIRSVSPVMAAIGPAP
jgi:hypothetical protein